MKKLTLIIMAMALSVAIFHSCTEPLTEEMASDESSLKSASNAKSYIVVLNDAELNAELATQTGYEAKQKSAKTAAEKILKRAEITDGELGFVYGTAIQGFSVKIASGQLKKLQDDPSVSYIEEDQIVTLIIPDVKIQGKPTKPPTAPSDIIPWGIKRVGGGINYTGTNKVWIIDTGIDSDHPDLNVDTEFSVNFVEKEFSYEDLNGHGTHVAGTIAAELDYSGVVGVAAGAKVVAVRVLNRQGSGSYSSIIAGVDYVAAKGNTGDVANMSLGGSKDDALNKAVIAASAKVKFALAAGNESTFASTKSPASAEGDNIYTISAMDNKGVFAYFSNYGDLSNGKPVDYCEPGVSIYSTYKDGGYATLSGTSMAAPHMAGILLFGPVITNGYVTGDKDTSPDPIGVHKIPN